MNMKRINEVPVIEELGENSYVLVDNNGEAARIPGSKVGGGGGGDATSEDEPKIYVKDDFPIQGGSEKMLDAYADKDFTVKLSYADGYNIITSQRYIMYKSDKLSFWEILIPSGISWEGNAKVITARLSAGGEQALIDLAFADSNLT